jgi:hypothetical protein
MPDKAVFWSMLNHIRTQGLAILAQLTAWSDRIYWDGYAPVAKTCLIIAAVGAVFLCAVAYANERDTEVWSGLAIAGRWMGGIAVVAVVFFAWTGGHGLA